MENKYLYSFTINGIKFEFYSNCCIAKMQSTYSMSYKGYPVLTVKNTEVTEAIESLTLNGIYKDFNLFDKMQEIDNKIQIELKKSAEYWNKIHEKCEENKAIIKNKIHEIEQYFNDVLKDKYCTGCLVYNKLEESIKRGYFIIYTGYSSWETIYLKDTCIKPLELIEIK